MAKTKLSAEQRLFWAIFNKMPDPSRSEVDGITLGQAIEEALLSLTDREVRVLQLRFGFDNDPMLLTDVGKMFGVTRERIRQIEGKALRKLREPARSRSLRAYLSRSENEWIDNEAVRATK